MGDRPRFRVSPVDAERMGIRSGDMLKLTSRRGEVSIKAEITERSQPGTIFTTYNYAETPEKRPSPIR